jgi:hypothetical protein
MLRLRIVIRDFCKLDRWDNKQFHSVMKGDNYIWWRPTIHWKYILGKNEDV